MADYKENIDHDQVTLYLDDDTEMKCDVIAVFPALDREYIAIIEENATEDTPVFLYRFERNPEDEDDIKLENIEGDEEFSEVEEAFYAYMDEEDEVVDLDEE